MNPRTPFSCVQYDCILRDTNFCTSIFCTCMNFTFAISARFLNERSDMRLLQESLTIMYFQTTENNALWWSRRAPQNVVHPRFQQWTTAKFFSAKEYFHPWETFQTTQLNFTCSTHKQFTTTSWFATFLHVSLYFNECFDLLHKRLTVEIYCVWAQQRTPPGVNR